MKVDVVIVAAHPDDAEICIGGTILKLVDAGKTVAVVDATRGEMGTRGSAADRDEETRRANAQLTLATRVNLGLPDGRVQVTNEAREHLARILRELAPSLVIAQHTDDLHPDHAATGRLAREAWYLSGLSRLADSDGSPRTPRAKRFFHFMGHVPFEPTLVIDIGAVWERKLELVRCYASQLQPVDGSDSGQHFLFGADILGRMETRARFFGERIGARHGEPLLALTPLASSDPAKLFFEA